MKELTMKGMALNKPIDIKVVGKALEGYTVINKNPLMVKVGDGYVMVTPSGTVVMWDHDDRSDPPVLQKILEGTGTSIIQSTCDTIPIEIDETAQEETFLNAIKLKQLSQDRIILIMKTFAISIALDRLEIEVKPLVESVNPLILKLQQTGKILGNTTNLIKTIGYSMGIQYHMISLAGLLDKPPETWESEHLNKLYEKLALYFEFERSRKDLNEKANFVESTTSKFVANIATAKAHQLEMIIIILIAVELPSSIVSIINLLMR